MTPAALARFCYQRLITDVRWCSPHRWLLQTCNKQPLSLVCRTISFNCVILQKKEDDISTVLPKSKKLKAKKGVPFKINTRNIKTFGTVDVWRFISVAKLAKVLNKPLEHVQEVMLHVRDDIDIRPTARLDDFADIRNIVTKCGYKMRTAAAPGTVDESELKDKDVYPRPPAPKENLKLRPPIVTVMGHVDHGKTTLLDTLRGASVAAGEAGGITQHIGAFTVTLENGESVTFLDTPGHAAFSSMRARGAHCTDIIVLVVAAEDGVMQQTKEVINLANEGKVPIIVAINKIDAPGADIEKTKLDLLSMGVNLEGHGGDVQWVCISALHGTNLEQLAEAITTQATLMELRSEYTGLVEGVVIESKTDPRRGKLSTAVITRGTLRKGSIMVGGLAWAKVRALFDHNNQPIEIAAPGTPVEILGWRELPEAGDTMLEVENEKKAHSVMEYRQKMAMQQKAKEDLTKIKLKEEEHMVKYIKQRDERRSRGRYRKSRLSLYENTPSDDNLPKLSIILKGDVHGSVEAILDVIDTYDCSDKCKLSVVHYGVGEITDGDIELAKVFNSVIYGFSIKLPSKRRDVPMRQFNVIYRLIEDLRNEINNRLPEVDVEEIVGKAKVLQVFEINEGKKKLPVLGCRCTDGVLKKKLKFKLYREDQLIHDGELNSMRHLKNEVESIKKGVECGLQMDDATVTPEVGDEIVCYTMNKAKQSIDWSPGF